MIKKRFFKYFFCTTRYKIVFLFTLTIAKAYATSDADIAAKYQLDIGQYLLPAAEKVHLKDWHHPDIEDYWALQNYLTFAERPELQYLNFANNNWREGRIRNFHLVIEGKIPIFNTLFLNNSPLEKKIV